MSMQFNIDEMLDILTEINHPLAAEIVAEIETAASRAASAIGEHFDCIAGNATYEGTAFAGTCAAFNPKRADQECPEIFAQFDSEDEWNEAREELAAQVEGN